MWVKDAYRSGLVPANFTTMANYHFRNSVRSSRAKNILDMVKEKLLTTSVEFSQNKNLDTKNSKPEPEHSNQTKNILDMGKEKLVITSIIEQSPNEHLETRNSSKPEPGPTDYVDCNIYPERYSITGSIFDSFSEIQTTNNSDNFLNLSTIEPTLFNESTVHHTITKHTIETPIVVDLTCNELMPPDNFPLNKECQFNTIGAYENSPSDFDSDDSVIDKDYCPSDSSEFESAMIERNKKIIKYRQQTRLSTDVTRTLTNTDDGNYCSLLPVEAVVTNNFNLERKRRNSIGATCRKKTTLQLPCLRKRSNTVSGNYYSSLPEMPQSPHKRRKYDTPLQQRKLDAKNNKKSKHRVKPGCNEICLRKCMTLMNQEDRKAINKAYWDMSWSEQHAFVEAHTYVAVPKRKITSQPKRKPKRNFVLKKQDGTKQEVCKIFFLTTLGYLKNNDRILHTTFTDPSRDKRGKHQKTPKFDRDLLNQHVESFNPLEPHYRREHAPLRRYLPSDINITQMHKHFCDTYPDKNISYSLYRSHLKTMNISFTDLGNEECELCEAYNFHKKETSHDATSQILEECTVCMDWAKHHQKYTKARDLYTSHKEEPQNNSQIFYSSDLEKVIMLPRLEMFKAAIFSLRLIAYNQTFAPLGQITAECKPLTVIWHDGIAGRRQEDIMSAFHHFLLRNRDVGHVNIWLDNCSSQNKNWLLFSMLTHMINSEDIGTEKITLYYFEPGHTFMSSDQVHHQVELAMKKKGKLYDFTDFEECVSSINKSKVNVKSMTPENFLNIPNYVSQRRIQTSNPRAYLKNMVEVCFTRKSYDLMYKNNFDDKTYTTLRFMNDKYLKNPRIMVFEFRTEPKYIESKRKADILKNLSNIIPPHKLLFWKNLPTTENEHSGTSYIQEYRNID